MDMDNGEGIDCGQDGWSGWRVAKGENRTTVIEQAKCLKKNSKYYIKKENTWSF